MEEIIYNVVLKYWYDISVRTDGGIDGEFRDFNISDVQATLNDLQNILERKLDIHLRQLPQGAKFTAPHNEADSEAGGYITVVVTLGKPTTIKVGNQPEFILE